MRIFLTLHPSANFSVPGSMTWYHNLYEPLIDIGHEVVLLRMDHVAKKINSPFRGKRFKEVFSFELISVFREEHIRKPFDLFFSYLTDNDVETGALQNIKSTGVPMVNFSCNNTHQFYLVEKISPFFDYNLHSEKDASVKFKDIGAKSVWFPMAANPNYYFPIKSDYKYDVSFIGAAYAKRAIYIHHLIYNKVSIDCFGPNWLINKPNSTLKKFKKEIDRMKWILTSLFNFSEEVRFKMSSDIYHYDLLAMARKLNADRMHYPCNDNEMIDIINRSKINLGFLEVYSQDNQQIVQQHLHLREFEIPMCRGLYLTNYSDELAEFYEIGKEVITYCNELELLEKVNYYLIRDREAEQIRKAAYIRAVKCHTYQERFAQLFKHLNIK